MVVVKLNLVKIDLGRSRMNSLKVGRSFMYVYIQVSWLLAHPNEFLLGKVVRALCKNCCNVF